MNYEKPSEWHNFGDMNPERHGGMFVKFENDMWHIIETRHYADLPKDLSENEHMFMHMYLEELDIWVNGNPYDGFTENTLEKLDSFSSLPFEVQNPEDMPENETYSDYVDWYVNNHFINLLGCLVNAYRGYMDSSRTNFHADYWEYLNQYGIEKENF